MKMGIRESAARVPIILSPISMHTYVLYVIQASTRAVIDVKIFTTHRPSLLLSTRGVVIYVTYCGFGDSVY